MLHVFTFSRLEYWVTFRNSLMYARTGARGRVCRSMLTNRRSWSFMSPRISMPNELGAEPLVAAVSRPTFCPHFSTFGTTFPAPLPTDQRVTNLQEVKEFTYLGLCLDPSLSMHAELREIKSKASKAHALVSAVSSSLQYDKRWWY